MSQLSIVYLVPCNTSTFLRHQCRDPGFWRFREREAEREHSLAWSPGDRAVCPRGHHSVYVYIHVGREQRFINMYI